MKKTFCLLAVLALTIIGSIFSAPAKAETFVAPDGIVFSNVCRYGVFYTVYPLEAAQPLGTSCAILNEFGAVIGYGLVSTD